jgi:hypothetical protein
MSRAHASLSAGQHLAVTRRHAVGLIGGALLIDGLAPAAAGTLPPDLAFDIHRNGEKIGEHRVGFTPTPGGKRVTSQIDVAVKVAFVTAYRYAQVGEDEWQDGVLVATRIRTNDDGKETLVSAEAQKGQLVVSGPTGGHTLPLGAMTDLNFWNQAITRQPRLIDSQSAEIVKIVCRPDKLETIRIHDRTIRAQRFVMSATRGRSGLVWYDEAGRLVKASVLTRGETLDYQPVV